MTVRFEIRNQPLGLVAWMACALCLTFYAFPVVAETPGVGDVAGNGNIQADEAVAIADNETDNETGSETDNETEVSTARDEVIYERVTVVGNAEKAARIPGSVHVIGALDLAKFRYEDVHRILRQVPGVNIQEEDGYGLRPNIGMRGTGVERSQKVTLLEDGVLIAPAPYSAPSAYYSPTAGRMEALEVRKGSSSIRQGPQTNGGVVNYVSTAIPGDRRISLDLSGGTDNTFKIKGSAGLSTERFGFLVEAYQHSTDGFKALDGGGDTGFELEDYLTKLRWTSAPEARIFQSLELKLGHTEQRGDETYLGLTSADFEVTPFRRYAGSQEDRIDTDHDSFSLAWTLIPRQDFEVTTTVYRNEFFRNWYKNESTLGAGNSNILGSPDLYSDALAVLRGEVNSVDDALKLRNNRREYYSQGIQTTLGWRPNAHHDVEVGIRVHEDEEDRLQEEDGYAMRDGRLVLTSFGVSGSQANRVATAEAVAIFVQDEITFGKLKLVPGLRYETVDTERRDYGRSDAERTGADLQFRNNSFDAWMPGLGIHYEVGHGWGLFGGVHRGYAPPSPSSTDEVEPEDSVNWELGTRFQKGDTQLELVGFFSDYSNLLGADTFSGGGTGTGDQFNGGDVDVMGLEAGWRRVVGRGDGWQLPLNVTYTYTQGEFRSNFATSFADWAPEVSVGDELPYLPEHQLYVELGIQTDRWSVFANAGYVSEMRTAAGQGAIAPDERIEDHLVFDLGATWQVSDRYGFVLNVRNLTDEVYVAARRPYGLRPGISRQTTAGIKLRF